MLEPRVGKKPISINDKRLNAIKQQASKGDRKTFSAPVLSFVPPPPPKRRPTIPHIEPPPLSLTPASPDTNVGVQIKKKKETRSMVDYAQSLPAYAPNYLDFGGPEDLNLLDDGGKDLERAGKRITQLSTITEKVPSTNSSPTIISLLHTERLSASKGRSSSTSSGLSSVRDQRTRSVEDSKSFDLFDLEQQLPSGGPDDLQFEMETGPEAHVEGETGDFLPSFT